MEGKLNQQGTKGIGKKTEMLSLEQNKTVKTSATLVDCLT